jgi:hypothetical protein
VPSLWRWARAWLDAVGDGELLGHAPGFEGAAFGEGAELTLPDLAEEDDGGVGATEALAIAIGDRTLALLGDVVLEGDNARVADFWMEPSPRRMASPSSAMLALWRKAEVRCGLAR